jgi:hypothetical protein
MTYYPDLSPYEYRQPSAIDHVLNIGWLDASHPFRTGIVPNEVLTAVLRLCQSPVNRTRGFHVCQLCNSPMFGVTIEIEGKIISLGSAEIRVTGEENKTYASPDLIYHYMKEHQYSPPEEFLRALRAHHG